MKTTSTFQNTLACIIAGIIGSIVFLRIGQRFLIAYVPYSILIGIALVYLLISLVSIFIWNKNAKQPGFDSSATLAFWQGLVRYFLALDLCMFGFQKIFHLQFVIPMGVLDNPFSSLTGEEMVWAFFGKFYAFTVIIAGLQIGGSLLLLFRRTRLFGVVILLPVLFNILLLDYFYDLTIVVNIYITLLTLAAIYLLLLDYNRLKEFFFVAKTNLRSFKFKNIWLKNIIRFSVIYIPLILISVYRFPQYYPEIYGKYEVKSFNVNDKPFDLSTGRDSVLTKIFIDKTDFVMEYNNYQRRLIGNYQYNIASKQIIVTWHYPETEHDTLIAQIADGKSASDKIISGRMGKQIILVDMQKVN